MGSRRKQNENVQEVLQLVLETSAESVAQNCLQTFLCSKFAMSIGLANTFLDFLLYRAQNCDAWPL